MMIIIIPDCGCVIDDIFKLFYMLWRNFVLIYLKSDEFEGIKNPLQVQWNF